MSAGGPQPEDVNARVGPGHDNERVISLIAVMADRTAAVRNGPRRSGMVTGGYGRSPAGGAGAQRAPAGTSGPEWSAVVSSGKN